MTPKDVGSNVQCVMFEDDNERNVRLQALVPKSYRNWEV